MRVVFFGTPHFAVPILASISTAHQVVAVVCQPDKPRGRGLHPEPPPVKVWASSHNLLVHQPVKLHTGEFAEWLRAQAADVCVLAAYGRILKSEILEIPTHGFLNVHPSLLPRFRGPAPIQAALLAGDAETGVTIIRLTEEMDAGDILLQESTPISLEETAGELSERLARLGARMILEGLVLVETGKAVWRPQDHAKATFTRLLEKEDGAVRWNETAFQVHNRIRACQPWPVAFCSYHGETVRLHRSRLVPEADQDRLRGEFLSGPPGVVSILDKRRRLFVTCGDVPLEILELQMPGRKKLSAPEFLRGHAISTGDHFEDGPAHGC